MTSQYRSAMGKPVDMAAIRTKNENVRAIGNMKVNSRGDIIDSHNQIVQPASQRVNRVYTKTTSAKTPTADVEQPVVQQAPATSTIRRVEPVAPVQPVTPTKLDPVVDLFEELSETEMEFEMDDEVDFEMPPVEQPKSKKK
jgi:hypothetical protein